MGVPLLYRWLSERYPLINRPASSPPFAEVDNLYIDANGILHNATHGANKPPARNGAAAPTEADMMLAICSYLDTLVQLVRPQRLLYVAIDGVAPRAKMNQQRQRRFRVLSYFIRHKLQTDELWRRLRVVLSSAEAPGEGEHKIAEHIRSARELPRRHCVYGLDADLIMLGLATHAPALCILREKAERLLVRPEPPAAPWGLPGGFSFAKEEGVLGGASRVLRGMLGLAPAVDAPEAAAAALELAGAHQLGAAIESAASSDAASLARRLLLGSGRGRVYVDWPYADVAVATSLATAAGRWWADRRGQLQECDIHPGEWRQLQDELRLNTLHHRALDTGRVALVRPLAGYSIGRDGSLQQRWADTPLPVPAQLVLPEWHLEALPPRSGGLSGLARLQPSRRVAVTGGPHFGAVGTGGTPFPPDGSGTKLLCPTEPRVSVAGVTAAHAPGEAVLYVRGSGPVPFGERGIVLATQGARCEVIFEHEGFCSFGHFSRLETSRAAVVPAAALLNLSRPPRSKAADAPPDAAAALFGGGSDSFAAFAKGTNPYAVLSQAPAE
ncbi:5'-3' exoribonuclease [Emiliania huxleyi CCMP1516]|uniref:Uncharacterized protein n=2 Tax=Emiliania huxleyi TaxID=2903 RepID=A0A0D3I2G5_EMIH1|nr:5'-3' exoribonuclease [Emiliania huxleyi CCMP1516]EOD05450.1 5'-3' exoribonuclease [Emiliania huxleyi CCMP1516]|eukprot:XP_005757879.1 5'-3' exoribonuclease [Emiliania huxleyi CCMP1516]